jgi:hypothetical protein
MQRIFVTASVLGALTAGLVFTAAPARAHCDSVDGPVAKAAIQALDSRNVNLVLPYAPESAEPEMASAFRQALTVRAQGGEARSLADRWFMETAVRLHRAGEHAPYTGLQPAGLDHGPAVPAAEQALAGGDPAVLLRLLTGNIQRGVQARFTHAVHARELAQQSAGVPAARELVQAELGFVTYAHGLYAAAQGEGHAE